MECSRTDTEAIYGGHISGRRLRGVKINPIFQENDTTRQGDGSDTHSESSIPVGEIQIEVYDSLPRHSSVRVSRSDPGGSLLVPHQVPFVYSAQDAYTGDEEEEESLVCFSDYILPRPGGKEEGVEVINERQAEARNCEKRSTQSAMSRTASGNKKQLIRQSRIDATSDDPDVIETLGTSPVASNQSSPSSTSSYPSPSGRKARTKLRGATKPMKPSSMRRARQLSAVHEMSSTIEKEHAQEHLQQTDVKLDETADEAGVRDDNDDDEEEGDNNVVTANVGHDASDQVGDDVLAEKIPGDCEVSDEAVHVVSFTGGKDGADGELFSAQEDESNYLNINNSILDAGRSPYKNGHVSRSKAMYTLSKIAMLPSYKNNIHHTSPVTSVDYINNNSETVPDLMLQRNGHLNGISQYSPMASLVKQSSGHQGESDSIFWDSFSLRALYSWSNTSSLESDLRSLGMETPTRGCDCGGRPTLKCVCGRQALQKLLQEKHLMGGNNEDDLNIYRCKSLTGEALLTKHWTKPGSDNDDGISCWSQSVHSDNDSNYNVDSLCTTRTFQQQPLPLRSILRDKPSLKRQVSIECKMVSFHKDTVFNENKGMKYLKECYNPSDLALLVSESLEEDVGIDNPMFEGGEKERRLKEEDQMQRRFSFKHPSSRNKISSNSSVMLKVSDLSSPSHMQTYLKGFNGCDIVRSPQRQGDRATTISIEAIGGITVNDPAFDAIGTAEEEEFEYYRRRRKHKNSQDGDVEEWVKKIDRPKKIKICVIIVTVIALVIAGIALAIHFGAPAAGAVVGPVSSQASGSEHRFTGVLF